MKKPVHILSAAIFAAILSLSAATAQGNAVQGEVRKIDEAAGKVTLKHGPIRNLGMDVGMTMVFRVQILRCSSRSRSATGSSSRRRTARRATR
jgi:Cu(I)/Ag(I) efflux system protein CusF